MTSKIRAHGRPQVNTKKKLNKWRKTHAMLAREHRDEMARLAKRVRVEGEGIDRAMEGTENGQD